MANEYYDHTTYPSNGAPGSSAALRAELDAIEAAFNKLPTLTGNGGKILAVNSLGTALEAITTTGTGNGVRATSPTLTTPDFVGPVEVKNGANAQEFQVYNTDDGAGNYERFHVRWGGNICQLGVEKGGTGTDRLMQLAGPIGVKIITGGFGRWEFNTSGDLVALNHNVNDLAANATRVRSGYFGTHIATPLVVLDGTGVPGTAGVSMAAGTMNWIGWAQAGTGAPAFTTRSAGTKLVLWPQIDGSNTDYGFGIEVGALWASVPTSASGFKWYAATTSVMAVTGAGALSTADSVKSSGSGGIGYATGAGGTVVQATSKSTGVTLNKVTGQVTMNNAALASAAKVSFVVTNSTVAATDGVIPWVASGGTANAYRASVTAIAAGSFTITVENITAGSLSESPVIGFAVVKGVTS